MTDHGIWFLGIDWGYATHQGCLVDATGVVHHTRQIDHDHAALEAYLAALLTHTGVAAAQIAVAIESPRGALVATLLARGFAVYAINPKQLDRFRDRFTIAGAKDDRRDAMVLADSLRTDGHLFRRLDVQPAKIIELREWSRMHDELQSDRNAVVNQMRAQLTRYFPAFLAVAPDPGEDWATRLLELIPNHASAVVTLSSFRRRALTRIRDSKEPAASLYARTAPSSFLRTSSRWSANVARRS